MKNELGITVEKRDLGDDPTYPGEGVKLPPVILASLGNDPAKKTVSKRRNPHYTGCMYEKMVTPLFLVRSAGIYF